LTLPFRIIISFSFLNRHTTLWAQSSSLSPLFISYLIDHNITGSQLLKLSEEKITSIVKDPQLTREITLNIACLKYGGILIIPFFILFSLRISLEKKDNIYRIS